MASAVSNTSSRKRASVAGVGSARYSSSARWIGCGWFQAISGLPPGLSRPPGPVIFIQRAPVKPRARATARAAGRVRWYHDRVRAVNAGRPHSAKWAVCHHTISVWCLPYQVDVVRPLSDAGRVSPICTAVRYCESTTRRSSSAARGSVLPAKSTAAPLRQNCCQWRALASNTVRGSAAAALPSGANETVKLRPAPAAGAISTTCGAGCDITSLPSLAMVIA